MPRSGRFPALLCYLLVFAQAFWVVGCQDSISGGGTGASSTVAGVLATQDLGQVAFDLYRGSIAGEPAGPARDARLAALGSRRVEFVAAINDVVNVRTLQGVGQTADALYALVDDDTLPTLVEHVAATLDLLLQDPQALDGLLSLTRHNKGAALPLDDAIALLGRMLNYPETEQLWRATVALIDENDGVDAQGNPNGEPTLVADLLAFLSVHAGQVATTGGPSPRITQALNRVLTTLTDEATVRGTFDFGHPEWVVRVEARGLPRVAQDPATGRLYAPFVDQDQDGLADVDAAGSFVDATGQPIDLATFGDPGTPHGFGSYDASGRAVAGSGAPMFVYGDAKRTILALHMAIAGELLARDAHGKARRLLDAGLGAPRPDGTYGADTPLADLGWGALELLEPDVAPPMLRAAAALVQRDPALAERVLVAVSRMLEASHQAGQSSSFASTSLSDPRVLQLIDDVLPLADDLFEQPSASRTSTARHLMETLATLRTRAPDFAPQLAPLFRHVRVEREQQPDADRNTIDEARSVLVDRALPARPTGFDNRSSVHQLLDLLARADGCSFFGQNLATLVIDTMAGLSPATVGTLVSILNATPGFLTNLVCSGISQDLQSLDALAKSGALDAFLPLAKAFKDRGETALLVRLLVRIQRDYDGVVRGLEEDVALLLESGAMDAAVEVAELSRTVLDPVSGEPMADAMCRALEQLVDDDAVVLDPRGVRVGSRMHLLLNPLVELDRRVQAAGLGADLSALSQDLFAVFLERVTVSNGVNGQEQLRNGSLLPLVARCLDELSQALPQDAATRAQEVAAAQQALRDAAESKDLATVLALLRTIDQSPSRALINRGLVNLLTPQRNRADDIFGGVARLAVILLQQPPSHAALVDLSPFLSRVLDPKNPLVPSALRAFQRLLTADQGQTTLNLLRAAFNPAPGERHPPAAIVLHTVQAVSEASGTAGAAYDRAGLTRDLTRLVDFLRDPQRGMPWVFQLIKTRQVSP